MGEKNSIYSAAMANFDGWLFHYDTFGVNPFKIEGKLSGILKTVAEGLKDEDNPVLVLMKMK